MIFLFIGFHLLFNISCVLPIIFASIHAIQKHEITQNNADKDKIIAEDFHFHLIIKTRN